MIPRCLVIILGAANSLLGGVKRTWGPNIEYASILHQFVGENLTENVGISPPIFIHKGPAILIPKVLNRNVDSI